MENEDGNDQDLENENENKAEIEIDHNEIKENSSPELCNWTGAWADLQRHITQCPLKVEQCRWDCTKYVMKQHEASHNETCTHFPLMCECRYVIKRHLMDYHKANECPEAMTNCRHCQQEMKRKKVHRHYHTDCPEAFIDCPFSVHGCNSRMKRKLLTKHIDDARLYHTTLQTESHDDIANQVSELREQCEDIDFDELRELQNVWNDIDFEELQGLQGDVEELQGDKTVCGQDVDLNWEPSAVRHNEMRKSHRHQSHGHDPHIF